MRIVGLMTAMFLAGCGSNEPATKVARICSEELIQQRERNLPSAEIAVVGKWKSMESGFGPDVGVIIGTIKDSQAVRGALEPGAMVAILTGDIMDAQGKVVQCGLTKPAADEERIFYISRGKRSLQVVDHRPHIES